MLERDQTIEQQRDICRKLELSVGELEQEIAEQEGALKRREAQLLQEIERIGEAHRRVVEEKDEWIAQLSEEVDLLRAQLHGLRQKQGSLTDDAYYSTKEGFAELEREYAAFKRFFEAEWKQTKKSIRKKTLWNRGVNSADESEESPSEEK